MALEGVTVAEAEQSKPTFAGRVEAKLELLLTVPPARPIREPWRRRAARRFLTTKFFLAQDSDLRPQTAQDHQPQTAPGQQPRNLNPSLNRVGNPCGAMTCRYPSFCVVKKYLKKT